MGNFLFEPYLGDEAISLLHRRKSGDLAVPMDAVVVGVGGSHGVFLML